MRRVTFFVIGALCGGVIGAAMSLLNAPESGTQMRVEAKTRFNDMMHEAQIASETRRVELEKQLTELTHNPQ